MKNSYVTKKFLKQSYKANPALFYIMGLSTLVSVSIILMNIYSLKWILDSLSVGIYKEAIIVFLFIVGINFILNLANKGNEKLIEYHIIKSTCIINQQISQQLMQIPYQYLEDPYYLDLKERAKFANDNMGTVYGFLELSRDIFCCIITIITLGTILFTFQFTIILVVIGGLLLNFLTRLLFMKYQMKFYTSLIPINRKYGYYMDEVNNFKNAKEFRMYSLSDLLIGKFNVFQNEVEGQFRNFTHKNVVFQSFSNVINYLQMFLLYAIIGIKSFAQKIGVGSFSLYLNAAITFSTNINKILSNCIEIRRNIEYLKPFIELMEIKLEKNENKMCLDKEIEAIEFVNLTFKYPKTEKPVLENISFKINKGDKISIVGINGAGKTTLIKLLCRLYQPTSGEILINGHNIFDYEYKTYIEKISAVFQDYKLFAFSLKENIIASQTCVEEEVSNCVNKVGLAEKIKQLPQGLNSFYGKSYDEQGIELSGGEIQKVAIARALYKKASLVILDEPTSALDPLAEADIYQNFNNLVLNKTAIYISHRMSSSVFCDKIIIIQEGHLIAYDTHHHLMQDENGLYYKLFISQAKNYQID